MKVVPIKPQVPRRIVRRHTPTDRLRGAIADLRECIEEREMSREDVRGIAVRLDAILRDMEAAP